MGENITFKTVYSVPPPPMPGTPQMMCSSCGALVADAAQPLHKSWHQQIYHTIVSKIMGSGQVNSMVFSAVHKAWQEKAELIATIFEDAAADEDVDSVWLESIKDEVVGVLSENDTLSPF